MPATEAIRGIPGEVDASQVFRVGPEGKAEPMRRQAHRRVAWTMVVGLLVGATD